MMDSSPIDQDLEPSGDIAASPTAEELGAGETPKTLEEAIEAALEPKADPASEPPAEETGKEDPKAETPADRKDGEDDDAPVPFHEHPRWKQVNRQLKEARQSADAYRERADRFDRIAETVQQKGLAPEDLDAGLAILAALKNPSEADARAALQAFVPVIERLQRRLGAVVDDDLVRDLEEKRITEERAREIARLRAERERTETETQRLAQAQAKAQDEAVKGSMVRAVAEVEAAWKADPDYETKLPLIQAKVHELVAVFGQPATPQQAQALAQKAKEEADAYFARLRPPPKPKATVTSGSSRTATTTPRTLEEALDRAFRDMRG